MPRCNIPVSTNINLLQHLKLKLPSCEIVYMTPKDMFHIYFDIKIFGEIRPKEHWACPSSSIKLSFGLRGVLFITLGFLLFKDVKLKSTEQIG